MILYHGTNHDFVSVDLTKSSPFKDFGRGFYLTDLYEQAQAMAKNVRIFLADQKSSNGMRKVLLGWTNLQKNLNTRN